MTVRPVSPFPSAAAAAAAAPQEPEPRVSGNLLFRVTALDGCLASGRVAAAAAAAQQKAAAAAVTPEMEEEETKRILTAMGYEFRKRLGDGGYGTAWLVKRKEGFLVLKTLLPSRLAKEFSDNLIYGEIGILQKLEKHRIERVPYFRGEFVGENKQLRGFFMTALVADNLYRSCIDKKNPDIRCLSLDEILSSLAPKLLKVLSDIRKVGLVHGDLKSSNIIYTKAQELMVVDWGLARQGSKSPPNDCSQTLHYRSLDVTCGLPLHYSDDLWSSACVLLEAFTSKTAFPSKGLRDHIITIASVVGEEKVRNRLKELRLYSKVLDQAEITPRSWKANIERVAAGRHENPEKVRVFTSLVEFMFCSSNKKSPDELLDYLKSELAQLPTADAEEGEEYKALV